ncbi:MAG: 4-alpha-glucanotransferase [Gammaproteobacteria bacterium]|nr:4-alpha-glucanotransferase [Gammaproteobacteria bacterium]
MSSTALTKRRAGVLLHPTSLPNAIGNGDFGADAERFVDFLAHAGFSVWQMLPLGPTHRDGSPYHSLSLHAGDLMLINLDRLVEWGWLSPQPAGDIQNIVAYRLERLAQAHRFFIAQASAEDQRAFEAFVNAETQWLDDYALYRVLRKQFAGQAWFQWPAPLRDRDTDALAEVRMRLIDEISQIYFEQFVFARQWQSLRDYASSHGVLLFGDMPIFVAHDSADVWTHRKYFMLDGAGQPTVVAGVPPDYFSADGQRWGNPLYEWKRLKVDGFSWWIERLTTEFKRFDLLRIDHFRGFEACWEIPAAEKTAVKGRWVKVPGAALFETLRVHFGVLPLVAEDLGLITPEVNALRDKFGLPGMKILQFAFDSGADNPYLPHNHSVASVVYTGTHDNDTSVSWFEDLPAERQLYAVEYLGYPHEPMPWPLIRAALSSVSQLAIIPMQDLLSLGRGHRMNTPGTTAGNWRWQFNWEQLPPDLTERLRRLTGLYGREAGSGA